MATSGDSAKESSIPTDSWCVTKLKTTIVSFSWSIENFSHCTKNANSLESSLFPTNMNKGSRWVINLYPRGHPSASTTDHVSVFLKLMKSSAKEINANFKFSVIANDGNKTCTRFREETSMFTENTSHGFYQFTDSKTLLDKNIGLLRDDTLKLYCEITITHKFVNVSSRETKSNLDESSPIIVLKDYGNLLEQSLLSDIILNVNGKQISAHKAILSARSPVFAAMFKHEMKETTLNEVDITDISHETMKNVLLFIYTGKTPNLETMADSLLSAADKYDLEHLKRMCEEVLYSNLSVENSVDTLFLADMHNAKYLKSNVIHFINKNIAHVKNTAGWNDELKVASRLLGELYLALNEQ